jgi:hypothetical protein
VWVTLAGIVNWQRFVNFHSKIIIADILLIEAAFIGAGRRAD